MLENIVLIAVVVLLLWGGSLGLYLWTSRQHGALQSEIEKLGAQLGKDEEVGV